MKEDGDHPPGSTHIHMMCRWKSSRSIKNINKILCELFKRERADLQQEKLGGRFKDQVNYLTNEYAGEHGDNPKLLDPEPIFYPDIDFDDSGKPKGASTSDEVVAAIIKGCTYDYLVRTYPKYMLSNGAKVRRFQDEAKRAFKGQQYIPNCDGSPRLDPAVRSTLGSRTAEPSVLVRAGSQALVSLAGAGAACGAQPDTPGSYADWIDKWLNSK